MCSIITPSTDQNKEWILEQLLAFNRQQLGLSQAEYVTPLSFHLKNEEARIIAGINAVLLARSSIFVSILWVDTDYRGQDYGSLLLRHVEEEGKKLGAAMIHLDTFDFQAKGFYLKQGYEQFASLPDSPAQGNIRFYLRKFLS